MKTIDQIKEQIKREYETFKSDMLQKDPETIFNSLYDIYHYDALYTYFMNNQIDTDTLQILSNIIDIIKDMKSFCYEMDLPIYNWNEIEKALRLYCAEKKLQIT